MDKPTTYTARQRTVDAMQITEDNLEAVEAWAGVRCQPTTVPGPGRGVSRGVYVRHLDGRERARFGDYLTKGPIRVHAQAAFEETFEAAKSTAKS
jgi:hypothetical protein